MKKKGIKKSKFEFTPTKVGALIEEFRSEFRVFGEKLDSLETKVEGISVNQARTLEKITALELRVIHIEKRLTNIEKRLTNVEERLNRVEEEIVRIKEELKEIKGKLDHKVDLAQFKLLEARVTQLEKKVETLLSK